MNKSLRSMKRRPMLVYDVVGCTSCRAYRIRLVSGHCKVVRTLTCRRKDRRTGQVHASQHR